MAQITKQDIAKISRLASLEVKNDEHEILASQIENVINWVEKLNEVDTQKIEPMINVYDNPLTLHQDVVNDGNKSTEVLQNAPKQIYGFFAVPNVIE